MRAALISAVLIRLVLLAAAAQETQAPKGVPPGAPSRALGAVFGDVVMTPAAFQEQFLSGEMPKYPASLRQQGIGGRVIVAVAIGKDGKVKSAYLYQGEASLGGLAVAAVKGWQFTPLVLHNTPFAIKSGVVFDFNAATGEVVNSSASYSDPIPVESAIPTPANLDQAIEDFAKQIPAGITADRYAAIAVAIPKDAAEYEALNKHALLVVAALSKDASELPLKRVYLEQENRTTELEPFGVVHSEEWAGSAAGKLMGTHRVDAYYLIPLSAWRQPGTLLADFAAHRQEFILGKFPQPIQEGFIREDAKPEPELGRKIAAEAIRGIVQRAVPAPQAPPEAEIVAYTCADSAPVAPYATCGPIPKRIRVSSGVAQRMLEHEVRPQYPEDAKASLVQGRVVLHVIIGKDGTVQQVDVVNGHPLLRAAAVEAVKQWRYRPFEIQGDPVEVDTQVSVVFVLNIR